MKLDIFKKHNLHIIGNLNATETLVFAHGYGSEQSAWKFITPEFEKRYRLVLFDMVGCGNSNLAAFTSEHYGSLHKYADDLIEICDEMKLQQTHLIAHSVSSIIGTLAVLKRPNLFLTCVFIGASPRYLDDEGYIGGFTKQQVISLLLEMAENYTDWLDGFAPVVIQAPNNPELVNEFATSLAKMRPGTSIEIARKIFFCDHRLDVAQLKLPVLLLHSREDVVVPYQVGEYLHQVIPNSRLHWISTPGHFPHMTNPGEIIKAITQHLSGICQKR
ncbi:alpha/beta fold hydrolase [Pantanalinema sp. GBBB05]|uniref:alpha/beta fold hydrolase n=1 Tax=Pantanalinema sp. GBBB05 TaxID=2604139 RepID=UPI001D9349C7|nr:alpha/beta hydrolase [Pantanalinema sp. GBBB05]